MCQTVPKNEQGNTYYHTNLVVVVVVVVVVVDLLSNRHRVHVISQPTNQTNKKS